MRLHLAQLLDVLLCHIFNPPQRCLATIEPAGLGSVERSVESEEIGKSSELEDVASNSRNQEQRRLYAARLNCDQRLPRGSLPLVDHQGSKPRDGRRPKQCRQWQVASEYFAHLAEQANGDQR